MIALALSILCASTLFVIFKLYKSYNIHTLYAIIVNYIVACGVGLWLYEGSVSVSQLLHTSWFWGAATLGAFFVAIFTLMAQTAQRAGVAVASIATKMALVIPVMFGVVLYQEKLSVFQITGIVLALVAVYLTSIKEKNLGFNKKDMLLPLLVFLGSGTIDTSMKYFEEHHLTPEEVSLFSAVIFGFAALAGGIFVGIQSLKQPLRINGKDIVGGVALGIPNYFSIFFLIRALQHEGLHSSVLFTLNNVAIVMLTTILGILLFRETMSLKNWAGIAMAILSIVLVALF